MANRRKWNFAEGVKIGRLTLIRVVDIDKRDNSRFQKIWECKCDCGSITTRSTKNLRSHPDIIKSCGCVQAEKHRIKKVPLNTLFSIYRNSAKRRGFEFSLSKECFESLISDNCYYCGSKPLRVITAKPYRIANAKIPSLLYNGIDRIDSKEGYINGNVVTCCLTCNIAKRTTPYDDFLHWVESIYNNRINNVKEVKYHGLSLVG